MLYDKPSTTIAQQAELLRSRGMTCSDPDLMERWLLTVGYYRLSAYWLPYETKPENGATRSKQFVSGTRFEEIIEIYVFDRKLRLLVTEAIERIEISVRSRWTNRLSLECGAHAHLAPENYSKGYEHARMVAALGGRAEQSAEVFVEHYREKYTRPYMPPLWAVTELMTFGELSKWVSATRDPKIKSAIARDLGLPTSETLEGTLQLLAYIRNICAHHSRLWNRRTVKRLPIIKRYAKDLVLCRLTTPQGPQQSTENQIYNALVVIINLLKHQSADTSFPARLRALIEERSVAQQAAMGFPPDWRDRPCWLLPVDPAIEADTATA